MSGVRFKDVPPGCSEVVRIQLAALMGLRMEATKAKADKPEGFGLNATEREYLMLLCDRRGRGELLVLFPPQCLKFKVGADRCWYTPDFAAIGKDGRLELHEVKGARVWDDARVKFQAARLEYPCFRWVWAQKKKGVWNVG